MSESFVHGHALLVGIGGKNFEVTASDAAALHDVLIDPGRAAYPTQQVRLLTENNVGRSKILSAFDELIEHDNKDPKATVVIYFSGHGGYVERNGFEREYFLVPSDYDPALVVAVQGVWSCGFRN